MGSSDIEHAVKLLTQNELAMDEIESIWEKVRSGEIKAKSRFNRCHAREEGKICKNTSPSSDPKGAIFMKCVLRGKLPQRRASFPTAFVFGRGRQTRARRALILIGDRVTAAPFSWSAKSVARIVPTPSIAPCQVHDVFLLNADSTPLRSLRAR